MRAKTLEQKEHHTHLRLEWLKHNRDRINAQKRHRRAPEQGIAVPRLYSTKQPAIEREEKILRARVRALTRAAVYDGRMIKPSNCEKCGIEAIPRNIHAHHDNYNKPFDVIWLCVSCHGIEDRGRKGSKNAKLIENRVKYSRRWGKFGGR